MVCFELGMRSTSLYLSKSTDSEISKDVTIDGSYVRLLKPFQIEGIRFLYRRFLKGGGVILNDEGGLGKTVQTVLFLSSIRSTSASKTLILCHEDTINHWLFHFYKWSTEKPVLYDEDVSQASFVVASLKQYEVLAARKWDIIVVDNLDPLIALKHVSAAKPTFKIWLTSVNLQADKKKLYKSLDWVSGNRVGNQKDFEATFSSNNNGDLSDLWKKWQCLQVMCNRWLLRRTAAYVASQLPIRTDDYKKSFSEWIEKLHDTELRLSKKVANNNQVLVLKQEPTVVCSGKLNSSIISVQQPTVAEKNSPEDELSPSILDFIPTMPADKDECFKRKGKDNTGLKIKRSKPVSNNNITVSNDDSESVISSHNQSVNEIAECNAIQVIKEECSTMQDNHSTPSNNMSDIATRIQPNAVSVKIETDNGTNSMNISGPAQSQNDAKFYLLDSLFSVSVNMKKHQKVVDVKQEKCEIDAPFDQNKFLKHSLEDHSTNVQEKVKFQLLDDFFFQPRNIHK